MRKAMVWGFVVVAVGLLFTGAQAQRLAPIQQVPPSQDKPAQQVEVVGGTVDVGNLPLDADGNVRVVGQSAAPSYRWIQVADQVPLTSGPYTFGPFDVAGWRTATFLWGPAPSFSFTVQYGGDGFFAVEVTPTNIPGGRQLFTTEVHGPQTQLVIYPGQPMNITLWLYLSN